MNTTEVKFWDRVNKAGPVVKPELGPCWLWTGATGTDTRYGYLWMNSKHKLAHRVAWFLETGEWPNPCALHKCDNTLCVRFSHLFEGTQKENVDDREAKGRGVHPAGENNGRAKLTRKKVQQVRLLSSQGNTQRHIGTLLDVAHSTVGRIIRGEIWGTL
jgi:hypothetical protein